MPFTTFVAGTESQTFGATGTGTVLLNLLPHDLLIVTIAHIGNGVSTLSITNSTGSLTHLTNGATGGAFTDHDVYIETWYLDNAFGFLGANDVLDFTFSGAPGLTQIIYRVVRANDGDVSWHQDISVGNSGSASPADTNNSDPSVESNEFFYAALQVFHQDDLSGAWGGSFTNGTEQSDPTFDENVVLNDGYRIVSSTGTYNATKVIDDNAFGPEWGTTLCSFYYKPRPVCAFPYRTITVQDSLFPSNLNATVNVPRGIVKAVVTAYGRGGDGAIGEGGGCGGLGIAEMTLNSVFPDTIPVNISDTGTSAGDASGEAGSSPQGGTGTGDYTINGGDGSPADFVDFTNFNGGAGCGGAAGGVWNGDTNGENGQGIGAGGGGAGGNIEVAGDPGIGGPGLGIVTLCAGLGWRQKIHRRHNTGQTNNSISHNTPLNQYTTTTGIGLRRKPIIAAGLAGPFPPTLIPSPSPQPCSDPENFDVVYNFNQPFKQQTFVNGNNFTWVAPYGVTEIILQIQENGEGGGAGGDDFGGCGGAGGECAYYVVAVIPGQSYPIVIDGTGIDFNSGEIFLEGDTSPRPGPTCDLSPEGTPGGEPECPGAGGYGGQGGQDYGLTGEDGALGGGGGGGGAGGVGGYGGEGWVRVFYVNQFGRRGGYSTQRYPTANHQTHQTGQTNSSISHCVPLNRQTTTKGISMRSKHVFGETPVPPVTCDRTFGERGNFHQTHTIGQTNTPISHACGINDYTTTKGIGMRRKWIVGAIPPPPPPPIPFTAPLYSKYVLYAAGLAAAETDPSNLRVTQSYLEVFNVDPPTPNIRTTQFYWEIMDEPPQPAGFTAPKYRRMVLRAAGLDEPAPPPACDRNFGERGNFHQTHSTGQTNTSISHDCGINDYTTTKGIGMRRKWIAAALQPIPVPPPAICDSEITNTYIGTESISTDWTAPPGVYVITVECQGAGGNGDGGATSITEGWPGGGGGGAGGYAKSTVAVIPGNTYAIIVGGSGSESDTNFGSGMVVGAGGFGTLGGTGNTGQFTINGADGFPGVGWVPPLTFSTGGNGADGPTGGFGGNGGQGDNSVGAGGGAGGLGSGGGGGGGGADVGGPGGLGGGGWMVLSLPSGFGSRHTFHQSHSTGQTNTSISHNCALNEWTTTKGIGMRRKWIAAAALAPEPTPAPLTLCGRSVAATYTQVGTTFFTVPTGVYEILVECLGGGGGGGNGNSAEDEDGGGGGGSGAYAASILSVNPGDVFQVEVGDGGSGEGFDGFVSTFDNPPTVIADYGRYGNGQVGGLGGLVANSLGDVIIPGVDGDNGLTGALPQDGADGGSAPGPFGGAGGLGGVVPNAGSPGQPFGSGGGGGSSTFGPGGGSAGYKGAVRISWASEYGLRGDIHQHHNTGQTNYGVMHCTPLNQYTTTKGIGMRRKWFLGIEPPPVPPVPFTAPLYTKYTLYAAALAAGEPIVPCDRNFGERGNFHQTHTTGQTNTSISHSCGINDYTTTKGIGMRRKWFLGIEPPPIPPVPFTAPLYTKYTLYAAALAAGEPIVPCDRNFGERGNFHQTHATGQTNTSISHACGINDYTTTKGIGMRRKWIAASALPPPPVPPTPFTAPLYSKYVIYAAGLAASETDSSNLRVTQSYLEVFNVDPPTPNIRTTQYYFEVMDMPPNSPFFVAFQYRRMTYIAAGLAEGPTPSPPIPVPCRGRLVGAPILSRRTIQATGIICASQTPVQDCDCTTPNTAQACFIIELE